MIFYFFIKKTKNNENKYQTSSKCGLNGKYAIFNGMQ